MRGLIDHLSLLKEQEHGEFRYFIRMSSMSGKRYIPGKKTGKPRSLKIFDSYLKLKSSAQISEDTKDIDLVQLAAPEKSTATQYNYRNRLMELISNFLVLKQFDHSYPQTKKLMVQEAYLERGYREGFKQFRENEMPTIEMERFDSWESASCHLSSCTNEFAYLSASPQKNHKDLLENLQRQILHFKEYSRFRRLWLLCQYFNLSPDKAKTNVDPDLQLEIRRCRKGYYETFDRRIAYLAILVSYLSQAPDFKRFQNLVDQLLNHQYRTQPTRGAFSSDFELSIILLLYNLAHRAWQRGLEGFGQTKIDLILRTVDHFFSSTSMVKTLLSNICLYYFHLPWHPNLHENEKVSKIREILKSGYQIFEQEDARQLKEFCEAVINMGLRADFYESAKKFRSYAYYGSKKLYQLEARLYFIVAFYDGQLGNQSEFFSPDPEFEDLFGQQGRTKDDWERELASPYLGDVGNRIRSLATSLENYDYPRIPSRALDPIRNAVPIIKKLFEANSKTGTGRKKIKQELVSLLKNDEPVFFRDWFVEKVDLLINE